MASIKTVLRKKPLTDGTFPICLRVTKNRRTKYFKTIFTTLPSEWNEATGTFNKRNSSYIQNNRLLLKFKDRALKVYGQLEIEQENFTLEDFEKYYRIIENPIQRNVFTFWNEIIDEMLTAGRTGNARVNKETSQSIKLFHKRKSLTFREVSTVFLNKYEVFLRSRGGTDGGIAVRMRAIRAVYNMAIARNLIKEDYYPFKSYKISKLKGKGIKKTLDLTEVLKIVNLDLKDRQNLQYSRNYFVFSFYTRGMNFADMMKLKHSDVTGDRIIYTRSKTKGNFIVKVLPPVQEILDYFAPYNTHTKYVFPILYRENYTPTQLENRKSKTLKKYNKDLKEIAKLCNISKPLSSYVARHSFANCLKQKGIATDIISESLGHQNLAVTQAYLKTLDNTVLDDACEVLLDTIPKSV
ncbi:site-specific integrase [Formosa haliotis]|uniref:site-specific integrase n=1 Tax=Formosa haliotis TaxID=1555194 RepID=UPI000825A027|nr:site-specific integrase [Formosa haliotis]